MTAPTGKPRQRPRNKIGRNGLQERTKVQQQNDRAVIAALYVRGWSMTRIHRDSQSDHVKLGLSIPMSLVEVSRSIRLIRQTWVESSIFDFDQRMAVELEKLDELEAAAWSSWEKSKEDAQFTKREIQTEDGTGRPRPLSTVIRTETRAGDPRWAEIIIKIIERRHRLLGLDAPDRAVIMGEVHVRHENDPGLITARAVVASAEASDLAHRLLDITTRLGPSDASGVRPVDVQGTVAARPTSYLAVEGTNGHSDSQDYTSDRDDAPEVGQE
jgi:hypothetical protein